MSNYPDDIHEFDNDPRSPFFSKIEKSADCETDILEELDEEDDL